MCVLRTCCAPDASLGGWQPRAEAAAAAEGVYAHLPALLGGLLCEVSAEVLKTAAGLADKHERQRLVAESAAAARTSAAGALSHLFLDSDAAVVEAARRESAVRAGKPPRQPFWCTLR
jgi:hypothetical protein